MTKIVGVQVITERGGTETETARWRHLVAKLSQRPATQSKKRDSYIPQARGQWYVTFLYNHE